MKNKEGIYQAYYDLFSEFMPEGWEKVALRVELQMNSARQYFYFKMRSEDAYRDSYHLRAVFHLERECLKPKTREMLSLAGELHKKCTEENLGVWDGMTLLLKSDGTFKVDFDYIDFEMQDLADSKSEWKLKYLNNKTITLPEFQNS